MYCIKIYMDASYICDISKIKSKRIVRGGRGQSVGMYNLHDMFPCSSMIAFVLRIYNDDHFQQQIWSLLTKYQCRGFDTQVTIRTEDHLVLLSNITCR